MQKEGNPYGLHRVIEPKNILPQAALRVDNNFSDIYDNEILCNVTHLNIDAASFAVIKERAQNDITKIKEIILDIVSKYGKHKNPWTGSGGIFIGEVEKIGERLRGKINLENGNKIASLVSLSLTPLRIDEIKSVNIENDQVEIKGQALLFESGVWVKLPNDLPQKLSLAVLDVAGAAGQVKRLVSKGDTVAILGARGKSGLICCYQAKQSAGPEGRVIAVIHQEKGKEDVENAPFVDDVIIAKADQALDVYEQIVQLTQGKLCDAVVSCVSRENCEMSAILSTRQRGKIYFFSMATSFTKAALGAEGVGKDIDMLIGNGYCAGHAELTLDIIRKSDYIRDLYTQRYC